jgi:hypothetical protein
LVLSPTNKHFAVSITYAVKVLWMMAAQTHHADKWLKPRLRIFYIGIHPTKSSSSIF